MPQVSSIYQNNDILNDMERLDVTEREPVLSSQITAVTDLPIVQGEVVNVQNWEAIQHIGTTIMVTFDQDYENGRCCGPHLKMYRPEHISSLLSRGLPVSKKDLPKLCDGHRIVQIEIYDPYAWRGSVPAVYPKRESETETYLVPDDLKLSVLTRALVNTDTGEICYRPEDRQDESTGDETLWLEFD